MRVNILKNKRKNLPTFYRQWAISISLSVLGVACNPHRTSATEDSELDSKDSSTMVTLDTNPDTGADSSSATEIDSGDDSTSTICDLAESHPLPLGESVVLGNFAVVATEKGFIVTDPEDGSREIYRSAAPALWAATSNLHAEESQGSFQIDENIEQRCQNPRIESAGNSSQTLSLRGTFVDCPELTFSVDFCLVAPYQLQFDYRTSGSNTNVLGFRSASSSAERIFGMGEQFPHETLNLKGREIPVLSQEGGIGRGHFPISASVELVSPGSGGSQESTYYSAAHYLTSLNRSLLLENTEYAVFDFRDTDAIDVRVHADTMVGRILLGSNPKELIERFTEYAGRMPELPGWVHDGALIALARPLDESAKIIEDLRSHGAQIAGVWNQTWSGKVNTFIGEQVLWNWVQNENTHPGWSDFVSLLAGQGIKTLCYINSMFRDVPEEALPVRRNLFEEANTAGYFVKKVDGSPYFLEVTAFSVGLLDVTNQSAVSWMKSVILDEMISRAGCSGWMADFGEALPFDAVMSNGHRGREYHNKYPVDWIKLNREVLEENNLVGEILVFNRSGHTTTPRHATLLWQGDQLTTWDKYDGLTSALYGLINSGFSGISLNHSDTGGYTSLSLLDLGYNREAEQLKRWTEMNAFTAVLRTHEGNQPGENAQIYSSDSAMDHFARFTKVYKALGFYRKQLNREATERGWPVVRHLMLEYPDDENSMDVHDQFMLGSEILMAPVRNKCWTAPICPYDKELYLPPGHWVHLWSGDTYGNQDEGSTITVEAPLGKPAVFYRSGSAVGAQFVANLLALGIDAVAPVTN